MLEIDDLRKVGKPAFYMCFVPAIFEIVACTVLAPMILGMPTLDAAILGCILAPVSAAIVVPYMLDILKQGYGKGKRIPQLIIAGTSIDDVLIIVLFTSLLTIKQGGAFNWSSFTTVPISIVLGAIFGVTSGLILLTIYKCFKMRVIVKVLSLLAVAFLIIAFENLIPQVPMSGMLAVIVLGITIMEKKPEMSKELDEHLGKIWVITQLVLFIMVGANVDILSIKLIILPACLLLLCMSVIRTIGVFISVHSTNLNMKEKLFSSFSYFPKATFQAAMGAVPLSIGMETGSIILNVAIISILLLAPIGAILIEDTYKMLLIKDPAENEK